jgi:hypothetical protein
MTGDQFAIPMSLKEFFQSTPPGKTDWVKEIPSVKIMGGSDVMIPDIVSFCDKCSAERVLSPVQSKIKLDNFVERSSFVIDFKCRICQEFTRTIAGHWWGRSDGKIGGFVKKIGEDPPFGPPLSPRVFSLVGDDKDNFLKGRRCEFQGLGIGAFAYYRRVVEDQWKRLLSAIIDAARRIGADEGRIAVMEAALDETQFSKAVHNVKDAIPEQLMVKGRNPLTLLHTPLSGGIHEFGEEKCLELATAIRLVIIEIAERLNRTLKDDSELDAAISTLLKPRPET